MPRKWWGTGVGPPWIPPRVPRGKNDSLNYCIGTSYKEGLQNEENTNGFALSLTAEIGVANFFIGFPIKKLSKN